MISTASVKYPNGHSQAMQADSRFQVCSKMKDKNEGKETKYQCHETI